MIVTEAIIPTSLCDFKFTSMNYLLLLKYAFSVLSGCLRLPLRYLQTADEGTDGLYIRTIVFWQP